ncbi:phenolpthiocerol synthesis polyketide synthase ppsA [Paramagnetospirillum caucaseum]|uniref:Phenolpthiocerol synthesis polyketide synthase ppsA n=1 Tax=Paramagnetospirillum caucaseum TaxID=1244869 RepID=M2Z4U9_9PROT|nr:type I polyketide synthase [Paramagnetospirillum caucaseum]EME69375.1 phenolpthiocerol synthesis polyketide synthase ppsA [Paramagnetospirillum caucaseum]
MAQPGGIAIIGIACRLAGASDWRQFWTNLCDGTESLTRFSDAELLAAGVPAEQIRDPHYVKAGYVLDGHDRFDAGFFGYSPHEARLIDPQQRHLLEVAWETFEDAGYPPGRGHGPVAVYATTGTVVTNYMMNALSGHPDARYGGTASQLHFGNDKDYASTRISFKLDLSGPSLNVQAACSTSLVMIDLACKAIRDGDCSMALAAAATVRVPQRAGYVAVKGSIFSPDGHIRTFDANAGGTAFSSGVVAVLLKDVRQALDDGDNIYAVIRGSAVNNDGGRKPSYTVTSTEAQGEVLGKALAQAGFPPATIGYVECHGTGTSVGDPKELAALKRAFPGCAGGPPCPIGSAKPNVGHAENASGLVSLVKTALMLRDGVVPPNVNFSTLNLLLKLETTSFLINTEKLPWRPETQPRRALINALGMGGTNAAVAVEEAPAAPPASGRPRRPRHLFLLSARTVPALDALVGRYREVAAGDPAMDLGDVCHTLAAGRAHFAHRFAVTVESWAELRDRLAAYRPEQAGRVPDTPRRVAFLYSGQGSQFAGMGRSLYRSEPVFRESLDRVAAALAPHLGGSILDVLFSEGEGGASIHRTEHTQPALFAVQVALADCLGAWGIRPMAVAGHSIGEFAAACLAGALSLDQAARLVAERGRLMGALPEGGAMAAVFADEGTVRAALAGYPAGTIDVAAVNGPRNTVISGQAETVGAVLAALDGQGVAARRLTVSHAFHSALMAPALDGLAQAAAGAGARPSSVPWVSTLTGQTMATAPDAEYWYRQAREAVRFADAAATLAGMGITEYLEIGPGSGLLALAQDGVAGGDLAWLPTLGKAGDEGRTLLDSLAGLHRRGVAVDWRCFDAPFRSRRLSLPTYAFQHERFWLEAEASPRRPAVSPDGELAGHRRPSPLAVQQFDATYGRARLPWLGDHRVHESMVLPVAAGLTAALGAARHSLGAAALEVVDVAQDDILALADDEERPVCLLVEPGDGERAGFTLTSLGAGEGAWRTHLRGVVQKIAPERERGRGGGNGFDAKRIQRRCATSLKASAYYAGLKGLGLGYGPAFRGIESLWRGEGEALARVRLPDCVDPPATGGYPPPALLDACLHLYPAVIDALGDFSRPPPAGAALPLPVAMERFRMVPSAARDLWCHVKRRAAAGHGGHTVVDVEARDLDGTLVAGFEGVTLKPLPPAMFRPAGHRPDESGLYQLRWEEEAAPAAAGGGPAAWLLLGGDGDGTGPALAAALGAEGAVVRRVVSADVPATPEVMGELLRSFAAPAGRRPAGIVHLCGLDAAGQAQTDETAQRRVLGTALALAGILAGERGLFQAGARLWLVTRNAVAASADDPPAEILQAGLWGFGRSLAVEMPALWGGLIDLEAGDDGVAPLAARLARPDRETQSAFRRGRHLVARLAAIAPPEPPAPPESGGTYVVTGGLGAIGRRVAEWLARSRKAEVLVLVGRQGGKAADAAAVTRAIEAIGARVVIVKADMGDRADVRRLMRRVGALGPPLRGIYHSAGLVDDGMVEGMDWAQFRRVLAPKLDGAWWLHEASRDAGPCDFVLFSSVLSLLGSAGQANYTAANACLDALAAHRRSLGLPALAVNWGPWAEAGMAGGLDERAQAVWQARGLSFISSETGGRAFDLLFGGGLGQVAVAQVDWTAFIGQFAETPPLLAHLQGKVGAGPAAGLVELRASLASGSPARRRAALTAFLRQQVTAALGLSEPIEPGRPLREVGLDSLMAVTLTNRIEAAAGLLIPTFNLIRGPSIDQLIDELWPDTAGEPASIPEAEAEGAAGAVERDGWLVTIVGPEKPRARLFCFPFAGGGSATFRSWGPAMDPAIEVIAVEPPGRLTRIAEEPERDLERWVDRLMAAMDGKLDLPFAFFGHCLGSLTLYEATCRLMERAGVKPSHLFCSGARAPDRLKAVGPFETSLMRRLARMPGYRPDRPPYRQPGPIFAEIVRHFDIAASEHLLADPELRRLMLPAVRADFEMASTYRYRRRTPLDVPITCFVAIGDIFVSREDILGWGRFTNRQLQILMREGTHYSIIEDEAFIQRVISRELSRPAS